MDRVAFIVDDTGEQISCLLNPETVLITRVAGVRRRTSGAGLLTGSGIADDPLLFTGGGSTRLRLDLLFDVDLVEPAEVRPPDVRQLTGPLWRLAENAPATGAATRPPAARFVWGRSWNIPGVVVAIAERFDRFTPSGVPLRSWLRLAFARTGVAPDASVAEPVQPEPPALDMTAEPVSRLVPPTTATGPQPGYDVPPGQLGLLSLEAFGTPVLWKELMAYNDVDDPLHPGGPLGVPPRLEG